MNNLPRVRLHSPSVRRPSPATDASLLTIRSQSSSIRQGEFPMGKAHAKGHSPAAAACSSQGTTRHCARQDTPAVTLKDACQSPEQKRGAAHASQRAAAVFSFPKRPAMAAASAWLKAYCEENPSYAMRYQEALRDVATMPTLSLLRARYPSEYKAHDNEKHRAKTLDPRLADFRDWLTHMGPRPAPGWSVDRINPKKGYLLGNMRWATSLTQTENQRVKRWHTLPDGRKVTTASLARELGIRYDTVFQALRRGTGLDRLLERHGFQSSIEHRWRFPLAVEFLEEDFKRTGKPGQSRLAWYCQHLKWSLSRLELQRIADARLTTIRAQSEEHMRLLTSIRDAKVQEKDRAAFHLLDALSPEPPTRKGSGPTMLQQEPCSEAERQATMDDVLAWRPRK